jgi:hypothetical protein
MELHTWIPFLNRWLNRSFDSVFVAAAAAALARFKRA